MKEILTFINEYLGLILAILTSLIAITEKVKKPIRNTIKKIIIESNKPLEDKINHLGEKLKEIDERYYADKADRLKKEIMDFASDIRMGNPKTEKQWETFITSHQDYEKIIERYNFKNGYTHSEYEFCMRVYKKLKFDSKGLTK